MNKETGLNVDDLIAEIAGRHNILLGRDEPMFVVLSVFELYLARYLDHMAAMIQAERQASLEASERAAKAAKATSERIITEAASYFAAQFKTAAADLAGTLTRGAEEERARIDATANDARRVLWLSSVAIAALASILTGLAIGAWLL